jgi:hypothetical protein
MSLKVADLRRELARRGLDTQGQKPQLEIRLAQAIAADCVAGAAPAEDNKRKRSMGDEDAINEEGLPSARKSSRKASFAKPPLSGQKSAKKAALAASSHAAGRGDSKRQEDTGRQLGDNGQGKGKGEDNMGQEDSGASGENDDEKEREVEDEVEDNEDEEEDEEDDDDDDDDEDDEDDEDGDESGAGRRRKRRLFPDCHVPAGSSRRRLKPPGRGPRQLMQRDDLEDDAASYRARGRGKRGKGPAVPSPGQSSQEIVLPNNAYGRHVSRLVNALNTKMRHWCLYEWFYAGIDQGYFKHNDFIDELAKLGIGHVSKMSRVEWGEVRGAMGRPRRLSAAFLREERKKLSMYRRDVRMIQQGNPDAFTFQRVALYNIPAPITVGQHVTALHPKNSTLQTGSILTADVSNAVYRVQFDKPELGVVLCDDTVIMPTAPVAVMVPRQSYSGEYNGGGQAGDTQAARRQEFESRLQMLTTMAASIKLLDRKKLLVAELRRMNDEAEGMVSHALRRACTRTFTHTHTHAHAHSRARTFTHIYARTFMVRTTTYTKRQYTHLFSAFFLLFPWCGFSCFPDVCFSCFRAAPCEVRSQIRSQCRERACG